MMVSIRSTDLALIVMIFMNGYNILREILRPFSVISNEKFRMEATTGNGWGKDSYLIN